MNSISDYIFTIDVLCFVSLCTLANYSTPTLANYSTPILIYNTLHRIPSKMDAASGLTGKCEFISSSGSATVLQL